jgi:hypothetical protein
MWWHYDIEDAVLRRTIENTPLSRVAISHVASITVNPSHLAFL